MKLRWGACTGGLAAMVMLGFASAATASLVADYRFDGTRLSSTGPAGALTDIGEGNAVAREGGCGVLTFPAGNGISVPSPGLTPPDRYTVIARFRFDEVADYRRILNFDGATLDDDDGLYVHDGELSFYDAGSNEGTGTPFSPGGYVDVAFTRDASKQVFAYANGKMEVSYADVGDVALLDNGPLVLFKDNPNDEYSGGAIERLRIYDEALSPAQIPSSNACAPPIRCAGATATIVGSPRGDTLVGTRGRDVIAGLGGPDTMHGLAGNDLLCGGPRNDRIFGFAGRDRLFGQAGNDRLFGQAGNDTIFGQAGNDRLFGLAGRDRLFGQAGRDLVLGGAARDLVHGGRGRRDTCRGGPGRDRRRACERGRG